MRYQKNFAVPSQTVSVLLQTGTQCVKILRSNIAVFNKSTVLCLHLQLSKSNGTSQWSVTFSSATTLNTALSALTQYVRLETVVTFRCLLSCQHLARQLTECIQIPIHPLQDILFAPISNTVDQRINTDCSQMTVPANVGVCTAPVPLIPCAFTLQNPETSHACL